MKYLTLLVFILGIGGIAEAQIRPLSAEEVAKKARFETIKRKYLNQEYQSVVDYYDSMKNVQTILDIDLYKMAYESYHQLAKRNPAKSAQLDQLASAAYNSSVKWNGKMMMDEKWDSLKIEIGDEPEIFIVVEEQPTFPGGMGAFYKYIADNMKYPDLARRSGVEGRVYVQFVVNKDGSIDAVNVVKGIGAGCDEEAARVIAEAPNFNPGKEGGEPVYVRMVLPIIFKLTNPNPQKKK